MAKETKPEPIENDFYKISDTIQKTGYKAEIDGQTIIVRPRSFIYDWREDGSKVLAGVNPAKGIVKDFTGRILSETEEGFSGITDQQMWELANAGVIILSTNQVRGHIARFRKYIKDNISSTTSTDY